MRQAIFTVDFDGTCVTAEFPQVGKNIGAEHVLRCLTDNGSKIILFTMRGHATFDWEHKPLTTDVLKDATDWFEKHKIPLWGVNVNPQQEETKWTDSPKPFSHVIIDDYGVCAPMMEIHSHSEKYPVIKAILNWMAIAEWLRVAGYLSDEQYENCCTLIIEDLSKL